jgi:hypothetical protein
MDRRCGRVHGGPSGGVSPTHGAPDTSGLRSSPAKAEEEEGDEAVPMRGSLEHEWRRGSNEDRWQLELDATAKESEGKLGSDGKRCEGARRRSSRFYSRWGCWGGSGQAVTTGVKALMPLMVEGGGKEAVQEGDSRRGS